MDEIINKTPKAKTENAIPNMRVHVGKDTLLSRIIIFEEVKRLTSITAKYSYNRPNG